MRQLAVADLQHVRVVPAALAGVLPQPDRPFIQREDRDPRRLDVARGAPEVARLGAPFPWPVEAPFANGIDNRLFGGAVLFGIFLRGALELAAHQLVLHRRAVEARADGVVEHQRVHALLQPDRGLNAALAVQRHAALGAVDVVFVPAVDRDAHEAFGVVGLGGEEGQHVVARFFRLGVERKRPRAGAKARDEAVADGLVFDDAGPAAQRDVVHRKDPAGAFARSGKLNLPDARRLFADRHVVAEIIFEVFDAPACERVGVDRLVPQRAGIILARPGAVGGIDAELQSAGVHIVRQRLDPAGEGGLVALQAAVLVAR